MHSIELFESTWIAKTDKLKAFTDDNGSTYILLKKADSFYNRYNLPYEFDYDRKTLYELQLDKKEWSMFKIYDSEALWADDAILSIMMALESYTNYLGEGSLKEFLESAFFTTLSRIDLIRDAINDGMPLIDLWFMFIGLDSVRSNNLSDDEILSIISSRKSLKEYEPKLITSNTAYYYCSPLFPYNSSYDTQIYFSNFNREKTERLVKSVMLINGDVSSIDEVSKVDFTVISNRTFSVHELKAINVYVSEEWPEHKDKIFDKMSSETFVEFFSRLPADYQDKDGLIANSHLERALTGMKFVDRSFSHSKSMGKELPVSFFTLTDHEADVYFRIVNGSYGFGNFMNFYYNYQQFTTNADNYLKYVQGYDTLVTFYESMTKEMDSEFHEISSSVRRDLRSHIESDLFNLREIFEKFIKGADIPLEMLLAIELDISDPDTNELILG